MQILIIYLILFFLSLSYFDRYQTVMREELEKQIPFVNQDFAFVFIMLVMNIPLLGVWFAIKDVLFWIRFKVAMLYMDYLVWKLTRTNNQIGRIVKQIIKNNKAK